MHLSTVTTFYLFNNPLKVTETMWFVLELDQFNIQISFYFI